MKKIPGYVSKNAGKGQYSGGIRFEKTEDVLGATKHQVAALLLISENGEPLWCRTEEEVAQMVKTAWVMGRSGDTREQTASHFLKKFNLELTTP